MSKILNEEEINQLLDEIISGDDGKGLFNKDFSKSGTNDMERSGFLSKTELRFISNTSEKVARGVADFLTKDLGIKSFVHVAGLDFYKCEEFVRSIPTPTFLSSFTWFDEYGLFEIDPVLAFEGILKQKDNKSRVPNGLEIKIIRELIVKPVMKIVSKVFGKALKCENNIKKVKLYTNPQSADEIPLNESGVIISFEAKIGDSEGDINFFLPEKLAGKIVNHD